MPKQDVHTKSDGPTSLTSGEVELLCKRVQPTVLTYCHSLLRNKDDAIEATQETFLRVLPRIDEINPKYPEAYFLKTARRLCVKILIARSNSRKLIKTLAEANGEANPQLRLINQERVDLVRIVLGSLDLDHQEPLILNDMLEMTYQQAADLLGVSVSAFGKRLQRAREAFAKAWTRAGGE